MNQAAAIELAGKHNATANNTVAIVTSEMHWAFPINSQERVPAMVWDVEIKTLTDYRLGRVTCGNCGRSWCERTDPCPSALCHWCHGRGYSTAPIGGA